ncbi:hypothetical protein BU23DRAFT_554075 [Bimuria novae-zelandiae CBS 107.79]|uniref:Uncharacterized protein n=1 Tax=Bimuria novae-zelandiae CBS 107.79 TaxID=1447943 RepID=A0A6A5V8K3_9PLEO|nr:hypothetical protein BU23DRAFT_554075 [Bimuria novae-zelandiae CBS 107.79]
MAAPKHAIRANPQKKRDLISPWLTLNMRATAQTYPGQSQVSEGRAGRQPVRRGGQA